MCQEICIRTGTQPGAVHVYVPGAAGVSDDCGLMPVVIVTDRRQDLRIRGGRETKRTATITAEGQGETVIGVAVLAYGIVIPGKTNEEPAVVVKAVADGDGQGGGSVLDNWLGEFEIAGLVVIVCVNDRVLLQDGLAAIAAE